MPDSEQIKTLLSWLKMKPSEFSRSIGLLKPDGIYHILNGRNGISDMMSQKILHTYPMISRVWLLTGEGEMIDKKNSHLVKEPNSLYNEKPVLTNESTIDMDANFLKEYFDALRRRDEQISDLIRQQGELISKIPGAGLGEVAPRKEQIG